MKKEFSFIALISAAGIAALYLATGYSEGTSFLDWLQSLASRFSLKVNGILGPLTGQDEAVTQALSLIAGFESFRSKAYPDPPGSGKYSIGYGHQIRPGDGLSWDSILTESKGYSLLSDDVQTAVDCVYSSVQVPLNNNQKAALISLAYNIGCAGFQGSTLLRVLNTGDYETASAEFSRWIYSGGVINETLVSRRAQEQSLFNS